MGLWCPLSPDPEGPQVHKGPRESLATTESREILVKTAKQAQRDLRDSQAPPETPAPEDRREMLERVSPDPEASRGPQDPPDLDSDRRSWTWRVLGSQTWKHSGAPRDCLAPPAPLVPPAPPAPALP